MPLPELRQAAVKRKQALFPVMSIKTNKIIGVLSKTDLVDPPRTRVALVDHNEFSQAVKGVEEAEIVEVMDHHRLGTQLSTRDPIRFLNEPVGSTSTLVARRFYHRNVEPSQAVAVCLCAGILSDTLNLTSPTAARADREMLEWLTGIAKIDAKKFTEEFLPPVLCCVPKLNLPLLFRRTGRLLLSTGIRSVFPRLRKLVCLAWKMSRKV